MGVNPPVLGETKGKSGQTVYGPHGVLELQIRTLYPPALLIATSNSAS